MAYLRVFESNRLEILVECLTEVLDEPLASPLEQEYIVVQSKGMERWLSMKLAQAFGIWGNCRYPFPNAMIHELIRAVVPDIPDGTPFDPKILAWRIMKRLPACSLRPGFESLRNYLGDDAGSLKHLQLAERLANTFDQYTMFRAEWVLDWEEGKENHWQALLWRELNQESAPGHKAAILKKFLERVGKVSFSPGRLPRRISIFGIPTLPPMHLEVFAAMSRHLEVNFFLMNPCREYWSDLASEKDTAKMQKRFSARLLDSGDLHLETGHPLLASLGKLGAHFFDTLLDLPITSEEKRFEDPGEATLLSCIQSDILCLRDRGRKIDKGMEKKVLDPDDDSIGGKSDKGPEKKVIAPDDDSIQIHVCHSPMREIEVLYDRLLALFDRNQDRKRLEPRDVLVMMPDIEKYAPYIGAVFEGCQDPAKKIPYSIADRSARREGQLIEVFLKILGLYGSRFGQTQVLDILEALPVQRKFGLEGEGLECVRRWVEETRIRWGVDGEARARQGVPRFEENTWKAGLDRLLLGYAMSGRGERMFEGILPYDDIEGSEAAVLGRFMDFIGKLFQQVDELERSRMLADWAVTLEALLERFFKLDESDEVQREVIRRLLKELKDSQKTADFQEAVDIGAIRAWLTDRLDKEELGTGFLTGGVTFCTMLPMRSIPHRVVALLGMDDSAFPRTDRPLGFDLMARTPHRGDPSKRDEDRYLFLEALLCARDYFLISYVGQSIRDNSEIPASVVVSELIETMERGFEYPAGSHSGSGKILDRVIIMHRLQAFSPAYFQPVCSQPVCSLMEGAAGDEGTRGLGDEGTRGLGDEGTSPPPPIAPSPYPPAPPSSHISSNGLLFSYSEENFQALCARQRGLAQGAIQGEGTIQGDRERPFISEPLPELTRDQRTLSLNQLARFLANPAQFFLSHRLGVRLEDPSISLDEREPFEITGLERYQVEQKLVQKRIKGENQEAPVALEDQYPLVRAEGILPPGTIGKMAYRKLCVGVTEFVDGVLEHMQEKEMPPLDVDLELAGFRIIGRISGIWPEGLLRYRYATIKARDCLEIWIEHLVLNHLGKDGYPRTSLLIGSDDQWHFTCVPDSRTILERILQIYWQGMRTPLPLFPRTSLAYAKEIMMSDGADSGDSKGRDGNDRSGDRNDRSGDRNNRSEDRNNRNSNGLDSDGRDSKGLGSNGLDSDGRDSKSLNSNNGRGSNGRDIQQPAASFPLSFGQVAMSKLFLGPWMDDARALNAARLSWEGNNYNQIGERNEPCFSLCFGKVRDPLGEDFKILARDIFGPVLTHLS